MREIGFYNSIIIKKSKTLIGNESIRRNNRFSSFVRQRRSVTDHDSFIQF